MDPLAFVILVGNAFRLEETVHLPVVFDEEILRAAAHIDFRNLCAGSLQTVCEHFRIHIPFLHGLQVAEAGTVVGIVRDGITAAGLHMRNFMNDEGGGQGAG